MPLLCVPFFGDQTDVAARVADAGAGLEIKAKDITASSVADSLISIAMGRAEGGDTDGEVGYGPNTFLAGSRLLEPGGAGLFESLIGES